MAGQKKEQKNKSQISSKGFRWNLNKRTYALIIFTFSFALYFNTLFNDYNLDDELVTQNHRVTSLGLKAIKFNFDAFDKPQLIDSSFVTQLKYFSPLVFRVPYYQDKSGFKYEYRPLVFASFALEHALFAKSETVNGNEIEKESAAVSHFINICLYALLCLLLFLTLADLFKNYSVVFVFLVSMLFAAYPMHTEVVASIKNRDEIMALIFSLLSLKYTLTYISAKKIKWLALVLLFFMTGILSKPTIIIFALLIPLSVIIFTDVSFARLMALATILVLPSVLFSRLYSAAQQIGLGFILMVAVTVFYILKHRTAVWNTMRETFFDAYDYFTKESSTVEVMAENYDFSFLKNPLTLIAVLLVAILPLIFSALGLYIFNSWLACIPVVVLTTIYILSNKELKVVFTTTLSLIILFAVVRFYPQSRFIEMALIIFLGVQIFSGQKYFRIVGIGNYLVYALASVVFLHSYHFVLLLLFVGFANRKFISVTWILLALSLAALLKKIFALFHGHAGLIDAAFMFPLVYIFAFLLWKNWWKRAVAASVILLPAFMIVYFAWIHPASNSSAYYALQRTYYKINSIKAADPTPVQSVRPLKFLEYTVSITDPLSLKLGTDMEVLGKYLEKVFIPYPMSFYYGYAYIIPQNIYEVFPLISLILHLVLLILSIYFFRKIPLLSFSILFYLISISVFSNFITPIPGMLGDRFLLIPSLGFCVFLLFAVGTLFKQEFNNVNLQLSALTMPLKISLAVLLVLYSSLTFSRNTDWKDRLTLFRHDIKTVDNSAQAHNLIAVHLFLVASQQKDPALQKQLREEAIPHFKRALEIYPDFLNASYDLGRTYESLHMNDEALAAFRNTVKLDTNFVAPYFNIGAIMHNKGQYGAAIPMYEKFLTQYPKQVEAYTNLSFAYFQLKDFQNSIAVNHKAIIASDEPFFPTVNIAKTYMVMGLPDSALIYWEKAHSLRPNDTGINNTIEQLKSKK